MKLSVSVVATAMLATLAAAAPQPVSSDINVNSKKSAQIVARDSCDNVDTNDVYGSGNQGFLKTNFFEEHRQGWFELQDLAERFKAVCSWDWVDMKTIEENKDEWKSRLTEIEDNYSGLPGNYNFDESIYLMTQKYKALALANVMADVMENREPGSQSGAAIVEIIARTFSFYDLKGEVLPLEADINKRIASLDDELERHASIVSQDTDMPTFTRNYFISQAELARKSLGRLKSKVQKMQPAQAQDQAQD